MNTAQQLEKARQTLALAQENVIALEQRLEVEKSFKSTGDVYIVTRHDISSGRMASIEGAFDSEDEAIRFINNLPGYGLNKDLFVRPVPLYSL